MNLLVSSRASTSELTEGNGIQWGGIELCNVITRSYHSLTLGRISGINSSFQPFPAILLETFFFLLCDPSTPVN